MSYNLRTRTIIKKPNKLLVPMDSEESYGDIYQYNVCMICLDKITEDNKNIVNANTFDFLLGDNIYRFMCVCKPTVHKLCMNLWFDNNMECPICLTRIHIVEPYTSTVLYFVSANIMYRYCLSIFLFLFMNMSIVIGFFVLLFITKIIK